jgi:hypothetical protein
MSQANPPAISPRCQLARMISSIWVPQAIYAAAKLELADVLAPGPLSAREVRGHRRHRVLRAPSLSRRRGRGGRRIVRHAPMVTSSRCQVVGRRWNGTSERSPE